MRYFPINLDIRGKLAVVVGGGQVAARKSTALLEAGAAVTVIAPELDNTLTDLLKTGKITHLAREYRNGDLVGAFIVFAATAHHGVNTVVADDACHARIMADIADAPELGAFTLPAVMRSGDLQITVSTGGKSPALARRIRDDLACQFGPEFAEVVELLGKLREKLLTEKGNSRYNKKLFNDLVNHDLPEMIRNRSFSGLDDLFTTIFGPEYSLARLEMGKKDSE